MPPALPEPDFIDCPERHIVALSRDFTMATRGEIPALWHAFFNRAFDVANKVPGAVYGVSHSVSEAGFGYGVGFEAAPPADPPEGAVILTLTAGTYAVFRIRGPIADLPASFDAVFGTWLPASDWQAAKGPVFERYPDDPEATEDQRLYEIWLPVRPKAA